LSVTSVRKTLSGLSRRSGRCEVRGVSDEFCSLRVHRSSILLPVSLPVLLPIPGPPPSHSISLIQTDLLIFSTRTSCMVSLHRTRSLSPLIALLRRGSWVRGPAGSPVTIYNFRELLLSQHRSRQLHCHSRRLFLSGTPPPAAASCFLSELCVGSPLPVREPTSFPQRRTQDDREPVRHCRS
jgi:hypothetical protein